MRTFIVALAALLLTLPGTGRAETLYFIHVDHLNTPRLAIGEDGVERWRWDNLEPFGNNPPIELMGTEGYLINLPLRFPGQYADKETNLAYNYFRDYDPSVGRYTQPEPMGLAGDINLYRYARNNSLGYIDPTGENPVAGLTIGGAIAGPPGAVIGGVIGLALAVVISNSLSRPSSDTEASDCPADNKKPDCRKATKWDLKQAEILDEHRYKREHGAIPESRFDICKCKDGSIRIARVGQCGKTRDFWD